MSAVSSNAGGRKGYANLFYYPSMNRCLNIGSFRNEAGLWIIPRVKLKDKRTTVPAYARQPKPGIRLYSQPKE